MTTPEEIYRSGKQPKITYYAAWLLRRLVPRSIRRRQMRRLLSTWHTRPDADYIRQRVEFYCRVPRHSMLSDKAEPIHRLDKTRGKKVYYIDIERWLAYFPDSYRIDFMPDDVYTNPVVPSVIKARRLDDSHGENAVILPLNRIRHFPKPHDNIPFREKQPLLFFRGAITGKPVRQRFFKKYFGHPGIDLGDTARDFENTEWVAKEVSIAAHFNYQFILVLEGNDVSTALQWVMGSNCVPVMTRPFVEHWLMHSKLRPGVHYIEIKPDFSDVIEKINYYREHQDEADAIAAASRQWYEQFLDNKRELIISLLTLQRYFECTGQAGGRV